MDQTSKTFRSGALSFVRWILFLIVGFFLPGIAQILTGIPALHNEYGTALLVGLLCPLAGWIPVCISPRREIGAFLVIASIFIDSAWSLEASASVPSRCWVVYVYTDAAVIIGALLAAKGGQRAVERLQNSEGRQ